MSRGLTLLDSLQQHLTDFNLYVLCLDNDVYQFFDNNNYEHVVPIALSEIEGSDERLKEARQNRSIVEYYFTLSPSLPLHILRRFPNVASICSLDSDIYFFSSPAPIFEVLKQKSIIITPHKYSKSLMDQGREKYGLYNVSFQIFKNNKTGIACMEDWANKCIDWCYDYYDDENERFADQKYLDSWVSAYQGQVHVLDDAASGLAVWNVDNYTFTISDSKVFANNQPVIFYHFHHFKIINQSLALNGYSEYGVKNNSRALNKIYLAYWDALQSFNKKLKSSSEVSVRIDLNKSLIKLILIHGTVALKIFGTIIQINGLFLQRIYGAFKKK